ncbi:MAG: PASTA domain-containing protein [Crocinitomicaceae bacterium]|nr:PASTA domain-containing protein [Crocinitomicaceae bacterium]
MKRFLRFFISKQFLLNIAAIVVVWILIIQLDKWYLKSTTNFGQNIEVPSFYKIHLDDLDEFVKDKNLKYAIVDSVYLDDWPKGTVCWQYPRPTDSSGMGIKEGRTVELSVVPMSPKMVCVPRVTDMSKRMGETTLNSLGIKTKVSYKPHPYAPGFIMEQLLNGKPIDSGVFVPKGSRIELVVSKGNSGEATPLPNVVGLTIKEAQQRFSTLALTVHPECEGCVTEEEIMNAVITRQNPAGGESVTVAAGTTVTVWGTKGGL